MGSGNPTQCIKSAQTDSKVQAYLETIAIKNIDEETTPSRRMEKVLNAGLHMWQKLCNVFWGAKIFKTKIHPSGLMLSNVSGKLSLGSCICFVFAVSLTLLT